MQHKNANPHYKKLNKFDAKRFVINHYAGDVTYEIEGFMEKNKDLLSDNIMETMSSSAHPLVQKLFPASAGNKPVVRRGGKISGFSLSNQFVEQLN